MIAFKVSVIGGPILLIVSGCLGGSGVWWEWYPVDMLGSNIPKALSGIQGTVYPNAFLIVREWFVEQGPGGETRCMQMKIVHSSGFWAIQSLGPWLLWVRAGVLGRKRLGPWATLLSQNPRPKWVWVPQYCTLAPLDSWPALRKNQGIQKAFPIREAQWVDIWAVLETH